jgi:O-succinylbenzoate synthase
MLNMMRIFASTYRLAALKPILAKEIHPSREGALLRFDFKNGTTGYADCHPWVELGDDPLQTQLELLSHSKVTPLTNRSLFFASLDAAARGKGKNLFADLIIPPSHFLIANLVSFGTNAGNRSIALLHNLLCRGFNRFKVKIGSKLPEEIKALKFLTSNLPEKVKIRLDFNAKLNAASFDLFLEEIREIHHRLEFCEDPFPFSLAQWKKRQKNYSIPLACDLNSEQAIGKSEAAKVLIIKPAIQQELPFLDEAADQQKLVVTSYLDHPLGQLSAAYVAATINKAVPASIAAAGLLSHLCYEPNPYSDQFAAANPFGEPFLNPPHGTGFGFNDFLEKEQWIRLTP